MVPTVSLPAGVTVEHTIEACRRALEDFEVMESSYFALAHWLHTTYGAALVGPRTQYPMALGITGPIESMIRDAQHELEHLRRRARRPATDLLATLPPRVHIVRVRDDAGASGFAPVDIRNGPLVSRVVSLFLAHYLTRPESYIPTAA